MPTQALRLSSAAQSPTAKLILKSINATPALVNSTSAVKITAVFALNDSLQAENQTEIQLTATASIKDSTGKEVEKLSLIKTSGNEYSKDWNASVPAGIYSVDIAASSLQGAGNFNDALQIEVVSSGNATKVGYCDVESGMRNSFYLKHLNRLEKLAKKPALSL